MIAQETNWPWCGCVSTAPAAKGSLMATAVPTEVREQNPGSAAPMSHRQVMEALTGLLLGLFVTMLSATIVSNALPTITADLHTSPTTYTWVITSTLLATTITPPVWGKFSVLSSKTVLGQSGV